MADDAHGELRRLRLLTAARSRLDRERESVLSEDGYAWTRVLVDVLGGDDETPYFPHVPEAGRDGVLDGFFPAYRGAAVALAITEGTPGSGGEPCLLVSRRSTVNGHTGGPMLNAGEIVLFGGGIEGGETSGQAALRELGEEAGIPGIADDPRFEVWPGLCEWKTESGYSATAHVIRVPDDAAANLRPDLRELSAVGVLPLERLYRQPAPAAKPHLRVGLGRGRRPLFVGWFDSPSVTVHDADGQAWELFGLAGAAVHALRRKYPTLEALRAAFRDPDNR